MLRLFKYLIILILFTLLTLFYYFGNATFIFSVLLFLFLAYYTHKKSKTISIIFVTFFLIEIFFYFTSPYKSYSEKNGSLFYIASFHKTSLTKKNKICQKKTKHKTEFIITYSYNNYGFRDNYFEKKRYKFLIVGDSFVEGIGTVNYPIDKNLEKLMNCKDCVMNIGKSGNDIVNELRFLKEIYQKDMTAETVLLNINNSDINDLIYRSKHYNINIKRPSMVLEFFYGSSFIFRYYCHNVLKLNYNLVQQQQQEEFNKISKEKIFEYILKFDEFCKKNNTKFIVVFQPMLWEIQNKKFELQSVISKIKKEKIFYIDANNFIDSHLEEYYWPIDLHFNDKGYKAYSTYLYINFTEIAYNNEK